MKYVAPTRGTAARSSSTPARRLLAALLLAVAVAVAAAPPAPPDPRAPGLSPSSRLQALSERIRAEHQRLRTLEAEFTQHKESEMLLEAETARGVFSYAAPDRVRWEYVSPIPITVVIRGDEMTTWYHDLEQAERLEIGRYSQQVLRYMGAGTSLETLLQHFDVTLALPEDRAAPYRLELAPRYERVAKRLAGMTVWIDPELFLPVRIRYLEPGGDLTEYRFEDYRVNEPIPPDRFRLELPEGVVVRDVPLGRQP